MTEIKTDAACYWSYPSNVAQTIPGPWHLSHVICYGFSPCFFLFMSFIFMCKLTHKHPHMLKSKTTGLRPSGFLLSGVSYVYVCV